MNLIPFAPIWILTKMIVKNGGVSFNRIPVLICYLLRFLLLEPFRLLEIILYHKRIKTHVLTQPPIFILGHWRSGTSFTQGLLGHDPGMTTSTIFRSLFSDCFYLTEPWLMPILNFICKLFNVPYSIQRIPMDVNLPSEADMALFPLASENSYSWGHIFPKSFSKLFDKFILFNDERVAENWLDDYDYFIRKLSFRSKGKRVVVKSPGDTGRITQLLKRYPDARFIYIHRSPVDVYHSNMYLWKVILFETGLQNISHSTLHDIVVGSYKKLITSYLSQRENIKRSNLIELQFEDVIKNPYGEMTNVYASLNLGTVPEKEIESFRETHRNKTVTAYSKDDVLIKELEKEWAFAFNFKQRA